MHYCYVIVDRDPVAQKQEDAGSLANFCPSLESGFDIEEQKNRKRDIRGIIGHGIQLLLSDRWVIFYVLLQRLQLLRSEYLFYVILYIFKVLLYLLWLSWAKLIQCPKFERVTYSYHLIICSWYIYSNLNVLEQYCTLSGDRVHVFVFSYVDGSCWLSC